MIPQAYITAWRQKAPWQQDAQVEQDMVIERALMEMYNEPFLQERLAFRGGTALYKLHLPMAVRYSEDIDLVQIMAAPVGPVIDAIRKRLAFLGIATIRQKQHNNTLTFRFTSEDDIPLKLKVEINCREHFTVYGIQHVTRIMQSAWYNGKASITTYSIEELLATKLRALYQRKKGRDLFDLWYAISQTKVNPGKIIDAWRQYMKEEGNSVSQLLFIENMEKKLADKDFIGDMQGLLPAGMAYDIRRAYQFIKSELLEKI